MKLRIGKEMTVNKYPSPGFGYKVREYLAGGNWKSAYRASSPYSLADVALLFFHDENAPDVIAKDVSNYLRTLSKHRFADYLATLYGFQRSEQGQYFMIEELLDRPLDAKAPVHDLVQYIRIARDLSRGLTCLHESKLVHRDLKLDNCGLDHQQRAKIFDLGSVTSEGGVVRGTVFTRAPELFVSKEAHCDFATDVWALGATLFALRSKTYPFVHESEVKERHSINDEIRSGKLSLEEGRKRKEILDAEVRKRILASNAERALQERVRSMFGGRPEELLLSMLSFERKDRREIQFYEEEWSRLSQELGGTSAQPAEASDKWKVIKKHLESALRKELVLTRRQIDRIISEYNEYKAEKGENTDVETALRKVKAMLDETAQVAELTD